MKTKSRKENLLIFLINYQVLITVNIVLYLAKSKVRVFYLKERYQCN